MRNLFQRADSAVRNVAGRIRSAFFSRGLAFLRLLILLSLVIGESRGTTHKGSI